MAYTQNQISSFKQITEEVAQCSISDRDASQGLSNFAGFIHALIEIEQSLPAGAIEND